jgi:hypothetical protein
MLVKTVKAEGLVGLYSGIVPTLLGILPYAGLKFYVYSALKQEYLHIMAQQESSSSDPTTPKPRVPIAVMLSAGGTAGFVAQTVTLPLDVVRRRMQVRSGALLLVSHDFCSRVLRHESGKVVQVHVHFIPSTWAG